MNCDAPVEEGISIGAAETAGETSPLTTSVLGFATALSLNSAAYTTQLFYGAIRAIPEGQWQSCSALGMSKKDTLAILLPYAFKRSLSSYSNEVVLVFKSTSLAYTITLMEVMGHGQLLYGRTYDVMVFGAAGIIYLIVNGLLTLLMRLVERKALAFERRN